MKEMKKLRLQQRRQWTLCFLGKKQIRGRVSALGIVVGSHVLRAPSAGRQWGARISFSFLACMRAT
jgi:hypothetical protein